MQEWKREKKTKKLFIAGEAREKKKKTRLIDETVAFETLLLPGWIISDENVKWIFEWIL